MCVGFLFTPLISLWSYCGFWQEEHQCCVPWDPMPYPQVSGEGKKAIPAISLSAQLFVTTWWCIYFICFSAGLLVNICNFEEDEFLPKCIRFWWCLGPCCPSDGNLSWNFQISCNPVLGKLFWSPTKKLHSLHTISFLSPVPLFSPCSCSKAVMGFPYSPFLFGMPLPHIMFLWKYLTGETMSHL